MDVDDVLKVCQACEEFESELDGDKACGILEKFWLDINRTRASYWAIDDGLEYIFKDTHGNSVLLF